MKMLIGVVYNVKTEFTMFMWFYGGCIQGWNRVYYNVGPLTGYGEIFPAILRSRDSVKKMDQSDWGTFVLYTCWYRG